MLVIMDEMLDFVSKLQQRDCDAAHELVRLGLYEALCDQVDAAQETISKDLDAFLADRNERARKALVREFIAKRLAGEPVEPLLAAARVVQSVSKADDGTKGDYLTRHNVMTGAHGRFMRRGAKRLKQSTNALETFTSTAQETKGPFDRPGYANMRATGAALQTLGGPNSATQTIGALASATGALGPEAERVLGPGLQRTAYRYRGTEKTPSSKLTADLTKAKVALETARTNPESYAAQMAASQRAEVRPGAPADRGRPIGHRDPAIAIINRYANDGDLTPDQAEMRTAGDIGAAYFAGKLPTPELTSISLAAGKVPPSQGIIIDADGDVVSEAMGFHGDHYVPFDLKNLRSLNGGQYVRTRATGGPTTEDIYTGLLTGARQMQVVSNSGVFTVEFDPDLRGGRRYSDKARQMVSRYQAILDAIDNSDKTGLYQQDLPAARKREIAQDIVRENPRLGAEDIKTLTDRKVAEERLAGTFKMKDDEELKAEAKANAKQWADSHRTEKPTNQAIAHFTDMQYQELKAESRRESVKRFQLDGEGYGAALKALQQEFPYLVRDVDFEPLPEFFSTRGLMSPKGYSTATDQNYVPPGRNSAKLRAGVNADLQSKDLRALKHSTKGKPAGAPESEAAPEATPEAPQGAAEAQGGAQGGSGAVFSPRVVRQAAALGIPVENTLDMLVTPGPDGALDSNLAGIGKDTTENEVLSGRLAPRQTLQWVKETAQENRQSMVQFLLTDASPELAVTAARALDGLDGDARRLRMANVPDDLQDNARDLATLLRARMAPAKADPLEYDPTKTLVPVRIEALAKAVVTADTLEDYKSSLAVKDADAAHYLGEFEGEDLETAAAVVLQQVDAYQQAVETGADDNDVQAAKENALGAQHAYAVMALEEQHIVYQGITGDAAPFVHKRMQGASLPSPRRPLAPTRSPLQVHPVGTEVATAFAKFLRAR